MSHSILFTTVIVETKAEILYPFNVLHAIIFDFNGIIVNDEPIHLELFQKVLEEKGLSLSKDDYYERYLGLDDRGCFQLAYREHNRPLDDSLLNELIERKARLYLESIQQGIAIFPGVQELLPPLSSRYPLAIASGALRHEIETILRAMGLRECFQVIVSAEDVTHGKPSPEIFLKALSRLNDASGRSRLISPAECLVIEDSREGISGAHRAGIKCLAVTNSHPAEELAHADAIVKGLNEVTVSFLESLVD
ncbi:MAG: HAD family phosphatase [Deltaproteobacteria bacterium]|nr:HAD family phosphatase [Deltaproteobacteria bacterium]